VDEVLVELGLVEALDRDLPELEALERAPNTAEVELNLRVSCVPPAKSTPYLKPGPKKMSHMATKFSAVDAMIQCQRYSMKRILV
jgi:hypothetical protein